MKFEMIDSNRIKVTVDKIDLKLWNINFNHILCNTPKARELFEMLMEKARHETNFNASNSTLIVEATPLINDGFVMIITKIEERKYIDKVRKRNLKIKKKQSVSKTLVYEFNNFDDVIALADRKDLEIKGKTSLYEMKGKYYLVISGLLNLDKVLGLVLSEYAKKIDYPEIKTAVIEEYAKPIMEGNVLQYIKRYF